MSAASFIGMAGIISFAGYFGSVYLMGWTGGYVLLALLLAPYLRKFGKFTVPDFVGDRYESRVARIVAVLCAIFVSFTYVAGQMRGVGVVFSRFLEVDITLGVIIGTGIVFFYAVLGGMKGITYTQVAQYCVLIFAFTVPAVFISLMLTGNPVPQVGFVESLGGSVGDAIAQGQQVGLLDKLDGLNEELGFTAYTAPPEEAIATSGPKGYTDVFAITLALMVGTAGLPHVIIRFYTVPRVRDARMSAFWALLFIAASLHRRPGGGGVRPNKPHRSNSRCLLQRRCSAEGRGSMILLRMPHKRRSSPTGSDRGKTPGCSRGSTRTTTGGSSTAPVLRSRALRASPSSPRPMTGRPSEASTASVCSSSTTKKAARASSSPATAMSCSSTATSWCSRIPRSPNCPTGSSGSLRRVVSPPRSPRPRVCCS